MGRCVPKWSKVDVDLWGLDVAQVDYVNDTAFGEGEGEGVVVDAKAVVEEDDAGVGNVEAD